jgi:hypothetical protein
MLNKRICKICVDARRTSANEMSNPDRPRPWNVVDEEEWHQRALVCCLPPNYFHDVRGGPPSWCRYKCEQLFDPVESYEFNLDRGYNERHTSPQDGDTEMVPILARPKWTPPK